MRCPPRAPVLTPGPHTALCTEHHTIPHAQAALCRTLRLETMVAVRVFCDDAEAVVPSDIWPLATYENLLFLDTH